MKLLSYLDTDNVSDTSSYSFYRYYYESADTIGKYYKNESNGHYMAFMQTFGKEGESQLRIFDIDTQNKTLKGDSLYISGNWTCCWDALPYSFGFRKIGDYYTVAICGSGTAYCCGSIYSFEDIEHIPENTILTYSSFAGMLGLPYHLLSSEIKAHNEGLRVFYEYEEGENIEINDSIVEQKATTQMRFTIDYILKDKQWCALDSTMINSLDLPL